MLRLISHDKVLSRSTHPFNRPKKEIDYLYEADMRSCSAGFSTALFSFSLFGFAQRPTPRLTGPITEKSRASLAGSRSPRALRDQDLGAVSPQTTVPGITLVFKRSADQENALQEFLTAQQNPASPLYHQWLTPDTFAARFGVAEEDIAATETWLQSRGFHIDSAAHDRITFSGNAAQIQAAFGTELHYYLSEGERHFAPQFDLSLPKELASITAAVLHLSDFRPKPNIKVKTNDAHRITRRFATQTHYLSPKDVVTMYDIKPARSAARGRGFELQPGCRTAILCEFSALSVSPRKPLSTSASVTPVLVPGSGVEAISPGDEGESRSTWIRL